MSTVICTSLLRVPALWFQFSGPRSQVPGPGSISALPGSKCCLLSRSVASVLLHCYLLSGQGILKRFLFHNHVCFFPFSLHTSLSPPLRSVDRSSDTCERCRGQASGLTCGMCNVCKIIKKIWKSENHSISCGSRTVGQLVSLMSDIIQNISSNIFTLSGLATSLQMNSAMKYFWTFL